MYGKLYCTVLITFLLPSKKVRTNDSPSVRFDFRLTLLIMLVLLLLRFLLYVTSHKKNYLIELVDYKTYRWLLL